MAVYSRHLGLATATPGTNQLLYLDPADGLTTVLRDCDVAINAGGRGFVAMGPPGGEAQFFNADNTAGSHTATFEWRGRQVLEPGWDIIVESAVGFVTVLASGYRLG